MDASLIGHDYVNGRLSDAVGAAVIRVLTANYFPENTATLSTRHWHAWFRSADISALLRQRWLSLRRGAEKALNAYLIGFFTLA